LYISYFECFEVISLFDLLKFYSILCWQLQLWCNVDQNERKVVTVRPVKACGMMEV